jgi:hypothetical protein
MARYILRYGNGPSAPEDHVQTILAAKGIRVIDQSPKMLLVDADEAALRGKLSGLQGWTCHPEQQHPLPDTRYKIK